MRPLSAAAMVLALAFAACMNFEQAGRELCADYPACAEAPEDAGDSDPDAGTEEDAGRSLDDGGSRDASVSLMDGPHPLYLTQREFGGSGGAGVRGIALGLSGEGLVFGSWVGPPGSADRGFIQAFDSDGGTRMILLPARVDGGTTGGRATAVREHPASGLFAGITTNEEQTRCGDIDLSRGTSGVKLVGTVQTCQLDFHLDSVDAEITAIEGPPNDSFALAYVGTYSTSTVTRLRLAVDQSQGFSEYSLPQTDGAARAFMAVRTGDPIQPQFIFPSTTAGESNCASAITDMVFPTLDELVVVGRFSGTCYFGEAAGVGGVATSPNSAAFAARYDMTQSKLVAFTTLTVRPAPSSVRVVLTPRGTLVVGYTRGDKETGDLVLTVLDRATLQEQAGTELVTPGEEVLTGLTASATGEVWITGTFSHEVPNTELSFGDGAVLYTGYGQPEGFVLKCTTGANCTQAYAYRSPLAVRPAGIVLVGSDIHVTGTFESVMRGGSVSLTGSGTRGFHFSFPEK